MAVLLAFNLTSDFLASTTETGITTGTVTDTSGSLASFIRGNNGYASDAVGSAGPASGAVDAASAITNNSYFFTTLTPLAGKQVSLTSLTINMSRGGSSTPRGYDIRSSVDSYASSLASANLLTTRLPSNTWTAVSVDLTGSSFQNITSPITFRIYIYAPTVGNLIDWDDLTINGTVADSGTVEQEGFRFRNDDGSETTATWLDSQDTNITQAKSTNVRLRVLLNSTLNRGSESYRLEFREVGGTTWIPIQ